MVFQPDPVDFNSWHNPSQAFPEKHVLYPRLTATDGIFIINLKQWFKLMVTVPDYNFSLFLPEQTLGAFVA